MSVGRFNKDLAVGSGVTDKGEVLWGQIGPYDITFPEDATARAESIRYRPGLNCDTVAFSDTEVITRDFEPKELWNEETAYIRKGAQTFVLKQFFKEGKLGPWKHKLIGGTNEGWTAAISASRLARNCVVQAAAVHEIKPDVEQYKKPDDDKKRQLRRKHGKLFSRGRKSARPRRPRQSVEADRVGVVVGGIHVLG